jgi:hypothetical protein
MLVHTFRDVKLRQILDPFKGAKRRKVVVQKNKWTALVLGTVLRDKETILLEVKTSRRLACIKEGGEGVETCWE